MPEEIENEEIDPDEVESTEVDVDETESDEAEIDPIEVEETDTSNPPTVDEQRAALGNEQPSKVTSKQAREL